MSETVRMHTSEYKKWNLGCGDAVAPGYMNVGYWRSLIDNHIYKNPWNQPNTIMLNYDVTRGIPASDESADIIFHSHFLEHLEFKQGITFLKECHRVLKKGAIHRIIVPDLELWIRSYNSQDSMIFDKYRQYCVADEDLPYYKTRTAVFMAMLHGNGHRCGWDYEMLHAILDTVGFSSIERTLYGESKIPMEELTHLEPYHPLRFLESLCIECSKS